MNKLEELHYNNGVEDIENSAGITKNISIKFAEWMDTSQYVYKYWKQHPVGIDMSNSHLEKIKQHREILFEEFINNHY